MTSLCDYFQAYRVLTGLVARPWCLMEICSKQEIINIVTGPNTETTKIGLYCLLFFVLI
jgi:hypothetical protein